MYTFSDENPTTLYYEIAREVNANGDEVRPRGRLVRELRPSSIEYLDPLSRVTFLATRRINPFFQLAESMWIVSGHADVEFLTKFNKNMGSFSDDGIWFNAPYGERIRHWGSNSAHGELSLKEVDQLYDVYKRLLEDKDTRQAMMAIGNPSFDNYHYLNETHGKDVACNLYITFKIRDDKLHMVVFNRSNDVHWGTFGANLCQFSTIQETLCSWLRNSGVEGFENIQVGTYHQVTDSLHIYQDSYGADVNTKVMDYYKAHPYVAPMWKTKSEPRIDSSFESLQDQLDWYWNELNPKVMNDELFKSNRVYDEILPMLESKLANGELDEYLFFTLVSMLAYRAIKCENVPLCMRLMQTLPPCQWKISELYFLKTFISKRLPKLDSKTATLVTQCYKNMVEEIKQSLLNRDEANVALLDEYLTIKGVKLPL